jgi:hypothetical protein
MKDFGNTFIRPMNKVCGHIGMSDFTFIGTIDFVEALSPIQFDTPTRTEFGECITQAALRDLVQPDVSTGWGYEGTTVFFPIPFVQRALIRSGSSCPLELIFAVREGYTDFMNGVQAGDVITDEIDTHIEMLEAFLWGIHQGLIGGISFVPEPDDVELMGFSVEYHSKRISSPSIIIPSTSSTHRTGADVSLHNNLEVLTSALTRAIEDQGGSAEILEKMHDYAIAKEAEKKEKSEKWHQAIKRLVLFASSVDGTMPELKIPASFRALINCTTLGNAEGELMTQMRELDHDEVEWTPNFTNALRNGNFMYNSMGSPSNFSIFMLKVKDPTDLNEQQARGMKLHILEQGKENNKNVLELIETNKNVINIPTTVEDLMIIVSAFAGLSSILFGKKSSLPGSLRQLHSEMGLNRLLLKGKVKTDPTLIAKLMFAVDNRVQLWFGYLRRASDREDVNDSILDFAVIVNEIVLDQFRVVLPPIFAAVKERNEVLQPLLKKPKKGKGTKSITEEDERKVVNKDVPSEFRLIGNEDYRKNFANKNIEARPMWDEKCKMCPRWWTHGNCFTDCRNAASHVAGSELSADKKKAFAEYMELCRRG